MGSYPDLLPALVIVVPCVISRYNRRGYKRVSAVFGEIFYVI